MTPNQVLRFHQTPRRITITADVRVVNAFAKVNTDATNMIIDTMLSQLEQNGIFLLRSHGNIASRPILWETNITEYRSDRLTDDLINKEQVVSAVKFIRRQPRKRAKTFSRSRLGLLKRHLGRGSREDLIFALLLAGETIVYNRESCYIEGEPRLCVELIKRTP